LERLEPIAKERSAKASGKLSGVSDDENVARYHEALSFIHAESSHPAFQDSIQEGDILRLHGILLSGIQCNAGRYKDEYIKIETRLQGHYQFHFSPVAVNETPVAVEQLILAYAEARNNPNINKLLLIPCVVFDFLCIYPFMKGNGRMSRLLSLLLLYKNGFDVGRYISFEEKICLSKDDYLLAIRKSSDGWHENSNTYIPFMTHFLNTLLLCYKEFDSYKGQIRHGAGNNKQVPKSQQIRNFILSSLIPVSKQEICVALSANSTTVESVLHSMAKEMLIEKVGGGRNTRYLKTR
jgi:Fic family protein